MDFSTLSRRELQALCKRNKLPANLTNVAMADSLKNLKLVEGIEELLNQSPQKTMNGSLSIPRTAARTSARRRPITEEPESSQPLTRNHRGGIRRAVAEEVVDLEMAEVVPKTPAAPSTRSRAPAASARQKTETQKETASVQKSVYNTRRSVRLLEKTMANLSLGYENSMPLKMNELSSEINNDSEKTDVSVDEGSNMQTVSEANSERVDVSDVPLENEGKLNGDAGENSKADVIEVDDFEQKSEPEAEVSESEAALDDIVVSEVTDAAYDKKPNDEETENYLAAKVSDDVSAEKPEDDITTVEDQNLENDDSDSKSAAGETENVKDVSNIGEADKPEPLTLSLSGDQQPMLSGKDSAYEVAEADYNEKFDFESDSIKDGDSDDSTEGEFSEDEATDENSVECDEFDSETESMTEDGSDDAVAEEGEKIGDESLVGASNVTKVAEVVVNNSEVDVCVEGNPALDKAPTLPPSESEQLPLQFPRPTLSKPGKSPGKKRSEVMSYIFDDNEENIDDGSDNGGVEVKRDADATDKDSVASGLEAKSLRQLRTMLKSQLKIKTEDKMVEKPRTALQEVAENQMAGNGN
ncbi:unnamed protein product [Malus baccata var. baccata]